MEAVKGTTMKQKLLALFMGMVVLTACGTVVQAKHQDYSAPLNGATTAQVTLNSVSEALTVNPLTSGSTNLIEAKVDYFGVMTWNANGGAVTLTENANNLNDNGGTLNWVVSMNAAIPLNLSITGASSSVQLNLKDFTLSGLKVGTSSGTLTLDLPATAQQYEASVETSSGSIGTTVEDKGQINFSKLNSTSGNITLNTGSSSTLATAMSTSSGNITFNGGGDLNLTGSITTTSGRIYLNLDDNSAAKLDLSTSSGNITVGIPKDSAVRLEIKDNSSGSVSVPQWFQRVSGSDKTGVWETSGYDQAARQIAITIDHDSSGAIEIA